MTLKSLDHRYMTALFAFMREVASYEEKYNAAAQQARETFPNQEIKHPARIDRLLRPEITKIERKLDYMLGLRKRGSETLIGRAQLQTKAWVHKRRAEYDGEWHAVNKPGDVTYSAASAAKPQGGSAHRLQNDADAIQADPSLQTREEIGRVVFKSFEDDFREFNKSLEETIMAFRKLQFDQDRHGSFEPFLDKKSMDGVRQCAGEAMTKFALIASDHPNIFTRHQADTAKVVRESLGFSGLTR